MSKTIISESIINNLNEYYKLIGNSEYVNYIKTDYYESIKGHNNFWPKMVFNISNVGNIEVFKEIKNEIINKKLPPYILLSDYNNKIDHVSLDKLGFKPVMAWNGMHINVNNYPENKYESSTMTINVAKDEDIKEFTDVLNNSLLNKNKASYKIFNDIEKSDNLNIFVGKENNKVVSSSLSYILNNTAGLYMITTLPDFREKGYGTQITDFAIKNAKDQNINNIVLHATKLGKKIYSKIGFRTYCNIYIYWLLGNY